MLSEAWEAIVAALNNPVVRAATVVFSAASLIFSIWAFRKTSVAANTFIRHVSADHARFLEGRWLRTYELTMTNPEFAEGTARLFGASCGSGEAGGGLAHVPEHLADQLQVDEERCRDARSL
jgi:hypothetical protein